MVQYLNFRGKSGDSSFPLSFFHQYGDIFAANRPLAHV